MQLVSSQDSFDTLPARECDSVSFPTGWENLDEYQMLKVLKMNETADKLGRVKHIIKQTLLKVPGDDFGYKYLTDIL